MADESNETVAPEQAPVEDYYAGRILNIGSNEIRTRAILKVVDLQAGITRFNLGQLINATPDQQYDSQTRRSVAHGMETLISGDIKVSYWSV